MLEYSFPLLFMKKLHSCCICIAVTALTFLSLMDFFNHELLQGPIIIVLRQVIQTSLHIYGVRWFLYLLLYLVSLRSTVVVVL